MAKSIVENDLKAIEDILKSQVDAVSLGFISSALGGKTPRRTLQYRLRHLINEKE